MGSPLVSVIMPAYNSETFIDRSIKSVLTQTYKNLELIVVDDKSTDGTFILAQKASHDDPRVTAIQLKRNSGAAVARNKATDVAQGEYIAFLDSDDLWREDKLEQQIQFMKENKIELSHHDYQRVSEEGKKLGIRHTKKFVSYFDLLKGESLGCLSVVYHVKNIGKFYMDPTLRSRQDIHCWLQILKNTEFSHRLPFNLASYTVRKQSISSNKLKAAKIFWKVLRVYEQIKLFHAIRYFSIYAFKNLTLRIESKLRRSLKNASL